MFNEAVFFQNIRRVFRIKLSQVQVDVIRAILNTRDWNGVGISIPQRAYIFATAYHESKFRPIKEIRARVGTDLRATQDKYWHTRFYGRGLIQLTHRDNYEKIGDRINVDLDYNPDLALEFDIAVKILFSWFYDGNHAGDKITKYINSKKNDYTNARRLVNGTDKAAEIAEIAEMFEKILTQSILIQSAPIPALPPRTKPPEIVEIPNVPQPSEPETTKMNAKQKTGLIAAVIAFLSDTFGVDPSYLFSLYDFIAPYWEMKSVRIVIYAAITLILYLKWTGKLNDIVERLKNAYSTLIK